MESRLRVILFALAAVRYSNGATMTEHCNDSLICVNQPPIYESYQENIDNIVKKNRPLITKDNFEILEDLEPVMAGDDENCRTVTTVEKPFVIKTNVSSEIVVQSKYFEQKIRITKCKDLGTSCLGSLKDPSFFKTSCVEKTGAVSLYIYDPAINQVRYKMFEVPICCTCVIRG